MKKLTLFIIILLVCAIPISCVLLSFSATPIYLSTVHVTWENVIQPGWKFSHIISCDPPNLFLQADNSKYGKYYACNIETHGCILSSSEQASSVESSNKSSHSIPSTVPPKPSGKIIDSITVRADFPKAYTNKSFILLEDGSVWHLSSLLSGLEQGIYIAIGIVSFLMGLIIDEVVLVIAWAKKPKKPATNTEASSGVQ